MFLSIDNRWNKSVSLSKGESPAMAGDSRSAFVGSVFRRAGLQDPENAGNPIFLTQVRSQIIAFFKREKMKDGTRVFNLCDTSCDWGSLIPNATETLPSFGLLVFPKAAQQRVIENSEAFWGLKPEDPKPKVVTAPDDISDETWTSMILAGGVGCEQLATHQVSFDFLFVTAYFDKNDKNGLAVIPSNAQLVRRGLNTAKDVEAFLKTLPATIQGSDLTSLATFLGSQTDVGNAAKPDTEKTLKQDLANLLQSAKNIHAHLLETAAKDPLFNNLKGKKPTRDFEIALIQAQGHLRQNQPLAVLSVEMLALQNQAFELAERMDRFKAMVDISAQVEEMLASKTEALQRIGKSLPADLVQKQKTFARIQQDLRQSDFEIEMILEDLMTLKSQLGA